MATLHVVLCKVDNYSTNRTALPIPKAAESSADTVTTGAVSAQSSLTAARGDYWSLTLTGGNAFIKAGANPTAASDTGWLMLDGQTREFSAVAGEKIAVIDAA